MSADGWDRVLWHGCRRRFFDRTEAPEHAGPVSSRRLGTEEREVLLHPRVLNGNAGPPQILAIQVW